MHSGDTVACFGMNNGFFVCLTKEHVASAHIAEAYLIDSSEGQFLPAFRALEFKGDCAVSNGADSAHLWCLTLELSRPVAGRRTRASVA